ncbi:hypothetical protein LP416_27665 [Polaromonas sp. P2-4]|nr:hypothetical protein LP416_27665 [Polaromonas sp. P2-4]
MTTHTHTCSATGCQKQIPLNLLMCMTHWRMVPAPLQREVLATWRTRQRRGDPDSIAAHQAATAKAIEAVHGKQVRKIATKAAADGALFE